MLIAEDPNLGRRLDKRPLIYPIVHESFVFTMLFIAFHVVETACSREERSRTVFRRSVVAGWSA